MVRHRILKNLTLILSKKKSLHNLKYIVSIINIYIDHIFNYFIKAQSKMKLMCKILYIFFCILLCVEYSINGADDKQSVKVGHSSIAPSEAIEKIKHDEHLLKEICGSILSRNQDIVRLKEKLNRDHTQEKYLLWRKYATGEEKDISKLKNRNEKDIVRSKKRSYLKKDVIENIQKIGIESVTNGTVELDENKSQGGFGIKITYSYQDAGGYGVKTEQENTIIENINPTKIVFGFSVDDIIKKILDGKNWNKEIDGYPATVYLE